MFVAIDRVSEFTYVAFFDRATKANAAQFLRRVIEAFPYQIHTVLTDNGVAFTEQERHHGGVTHTGIGHIFERVCAANGIRQKRARPYHPWTNGIGRAHESNDQGCEHQGVRVQQHGATAHSCAGLREELQLRQTPESVALENAV